MTDIDVFCIAIVTVLRINDSASSDIQIKTIITDRPGYLDTSDFSVKTQKPQPTGRPLTD